MSYTHVKNYWKYESDKIYLDKASLTDEEIMSFRSVYLWIDHPI